MTITRNLIAVFIVMALTTTSFAQFVDFSSQTADDPTWTANAFGGIMTASFSSSFSTESVRWEPQTKEFSDSAFVSQFGSSGSLIALIAQDNQPTAATNATFVFSSPLPSNARMVAFDYDGLAERIALSSIDGTIFAPEMMESNDPNTSPQGASAFASWSQVQQRLLSSNTKNNDREAYVFDVSGLSQISIVMTAGEAAASWVGFAVPEPNSLALVLIGLIAYGVRRRRS